MRPGKVSGIQSPLAIHSRNEAGSDRRRDRAWLNSSSMRDGTLFQTVAPAVVAASSHAAGSVAFVGAGLVAAKYFLPGLLAQFRREHEGVEIRLVEGNRQQLVKLLQANEVDVAVMGRPP